MELKIGAVILAAGEGKRLKLNVPKPLAPCLDKKLIDFPILHLKKFFSQNKIDGKITVVVGYKHELVSAYIKKNYSDIDFAIQKEQRGTADALRSYFKSFLNIEEVKKFQYILVICADTPVVSETELTEMYALLLKDNRDGIAASFIEKRPEGYGRIVRTSGGMGFHIVEEKDANDAIKKITEVNSGIYFLKTNYILEHLSLVDSNNMSGEFYLTDVFKDGLNVAAHCFLDPQLFLGVNTLEQLEDAEMAIRNRKKNELRNNGVRFIDKNHCYIDSEVEIGEGSTIYPNVYISGKTKIGKNVTIEMGAQINDSMVEDGVKILAYSILENVYLHSFSSVGPFARLRPGTVVGASCKIGNFVEIKKSVLEQGVKISHLSYVGDAFIGEETNIGCGFITCNYDGAKKHITKIGKNSFIGSDSQTVAPVNIGDNCFVASSSTITKDMPDGSFAISRGAQVTKIDMAKKFLKQKE